jgi:hypothetical protein
VKRRFARSSVNAKTVTVHISVPLPITALALRIAVGSDPALATNLHPRTTSEAFLTRKHHVLWFHSNALVGSRHNPTFVAQCNKMPSIIDWRMIYHNLAESSVVSCVPKATEAHQVPNFESHLTVYLFDSKLKAAFYFTL